MTTRWSSIRSTLTTLSLAALVALALPSAALAAKGGNGGGGGGKPGGGGDGGGSANPAVVYEKANHPGKMLQMDIDGANKSTVLDYRVQHPAWSAGGTHFVYATENPARGIYKCNADGTGEVFLAPTYTYVSNSPRWSPVAAPDGNFKIAFVDSLEGKSRKHVWLMNTDGSSLQILRPESAGTGSDTNPTWSPDGTRLAVRHYRQNDPDTVVLYTLGPAIGGGLEVVDVEVLDFTGTALEGADIWDAAYARDSERLVLSATPVGASLADLWIVLDGPPRNLTVTPDDHEVDPSWCGGDLDIVYLISNQSTIYRIDSSGANPTAIGNTKKPEDEPDCKF